jgi:hypothetical protein
MRPWFNFFLIVFFPILTDAQFTQIEKIDSFKHQLTQENEDSNRVLMMSYLAWQYCIWNPDSGAVYGQKALALSKQIKFPRGEARALIGVAGVSITLGDLPICLNYAFQVLRIVDENHYLAEKAICFTTMAEEPVNEKKKSSASDYLPKVSVSTKKSGGQILISIKDNGNGIPQKIVDKIFQPFFTTKPTGQGTGLGLSLSYDIVKAHGGEIKVTTKEGEGSEFLIQLPIA